jgi:nitrate reductase delta subunit
MTIAEYKILSVLLSYPTAHLPLVADEIAAALGGSSLFGPRRRAELVAMVTAMAADDLLDVQADYVETFDRSRALSLHLFEHVHGESRDRGQAMVSLRERYQAAGFEIASNELPDYLPLFLEFLSQQEPAAAQAMAGDISHILHALAERHARRHTRYMPVFAALQELVAVPPDADALKALRDVVADDPSDLEALDRAWEESEVRFGPGDASSQACPRASEMLDRMAFQQPAGGGEK